MKCVHCQAEMARGKVPFHIDRRRFHVSLDEVPAWVCPQCGESCFEEKEVESIQALIKAVELQAGNLAETA